MIFVGTTRSNAAMSVVPVLLTGTIGRLVASVQKKRLRIGKRLFKSSSYIRQNERATSVDYQLFLWLEPWRLLGGDECPPSRIRRYSTLLVSEE